MRPTPLSSLSTSKCTTGCPLLDSFLRGGVPCGSITELSGEAAAGKTQLCLQLLIGAVLPQEAGGVGGKAFYIYTEGEPPTGRLQDLAKHFAPEKGSSLLDNILVEHQLYSPEALLQSLERAEAVLRQSKQGERVRLIVIDSVAHLFRDPGDGKGANNIYAERSSQLFQLATVLKRIAHTFNLAVVVTNQVADAFNDSSDSGVGSHTGGMSLISSNRSVIPALGLAWASCVNTRLFLSRGPEYPVEGQTSILRSIQVVFSPAVPQSYCYFLVSEQGVRGISIEKQPTRPETRDLPV